MLYILIPDTIVIKGTHFKYYNSTAYRIGWTYSIIIKAKSIGAVEYIDCISAQGKGPLPNKGPGYHTKKSNDEALVLEL